MARKFAIIWIALVFGLAGCFEGTSSVSTGGVRRASRMNTSAGMVEHLQSENLPALQSVEVWENEYGPGLKLTTAHYEIFTTLLEPLMLRQVPGFVESAYRGYQDQLPEPIRTSTRFTIYLFATRKQWEDFTRSFAGAQAGLYYKIKAGGYYLNGACVAYNIGRERTFSVLGHEGWHQFNGRHFQFRLPSWLDEGIATLFEVYRSSDGLFYFEPGRNAYRLGALKQTLIKNRMIPFRELIAANPGEVLATNQADTVMAFYAQSYALVRFLREEDYGKRLRNYHQLLLGGLKGDWLLSAVNKRTAADRNIPRTVLWNRMVGPLLFEPYIGNNFEEIETEYTAFCRKIVYHVKFKPQN
ncbi:MAG: hypothetical protein WBC22_01640 [Sedimentisphaerales bacterium]